MTATSSADLALLRSAVKGEVHAPGDSGYDEGRSIWNAQIDRRPAAVVMAAGPDDVAAAIGFARENGLEISVRGGGHNTGGYAVGDGGLMINLARLNSVEVDVENRRAKVGGGALLADLDAATQAHGLATPGGMVSHTGVGGLTLGGGMGWLTRLHGLTIDNLTGAEVVLADGRIVWASETEHADLFWALRGGGGNFGVVTTFEFALHPVGPMVSVGLFFWEVERATDALRMLRDKVPSIPQDSNVIIGLLNAPPAPFVPAEHHFQPGVLLVLVGFGSPEDHAAQCAEVGAALEPLFSFATPMPYVALQQMQDEATAHGQFCYEKGTQLAELSDGAIDVFVSHLGRRTVPTSQVLFYRLDHAYSAVAENATAYGATRTPRYATMLVALTPNMEAWEAERQWVRNLWTDLQPYSLGIGDYVNNMVEFDAERILASYGPEKYARLAGIKAVYDPENLFRRNVNIPPAG
ncbi:FAD-binding oxidoreductase [Sporichthya polymorpha]|uniref:FAD-binding oxidoreductase n=1 Tax=Sporichthya polymorpha TaxID=35751 RepID=UPI0003648208|nr:FAD-binding oxidoreductase [Sporichthya polymorpha]